MANDNKINIIKFINEIDNGNFNQYEELSLEQRKTISMVVLSRWLSCMKNTKQLLSVNNILNPLIFKFAYTHSNLVYKLMLVCSSGTQKQYRWLSKGKSIGTKPISVDVISKYYGLSKKDSMKYLNLLGVDNVVECATSMGYDDKELTKIKNEFKK